MGFDAFTMDDYLITRDGKVINKKWNREVKGKPNSKGYLRVQIVGKFRFIHRLVAEKYIPNPNNLPIVNHIDGNFLNNSVENLEWVTRIGNVRHAQEHDLIRSGESCSFSILDNEKVRFIRTHYPQYTQQELADMFKVSRRTISDVINYKTWKKVD